MKATWYVSYEMPKGHSQRHSYARATRRFVTEDDAKNFARERLTDARNVSAGTLNPQVPKQVISSAHLFDWIKEPTEAPRDARDFRLCPG